MSHIKIERQFVTITKPSTTIQISHPDLLNIACIIVSIRCTLYDPKTFPLNISIAMSLQEQFQRLNYDYTTESTLADKFLSSCAGSSTQLATDKLEQCYSFLSKIKEELTISQEFLSLPYLSNAVSSFSNEKHLTTIYLTDTNSKQLFKTFSSIISTNVGIKCVVMNSVTVQGEMKDFNDAVSTTNSTIYEWVFNYCNFESEDFKLFIECFRNYKTNIKTLIFNNCSFTQSTFSYFTQRFFFIGCFHSLESFYIGDVIFSKEVLFFLCQLFASDWVLKNKTLKNLLIPRCYVELDTLFLQMQNFETGITTANFSGNIFIHPLSSDLASKLSPCINFMFPDCGFGEETFISLMQVLSLHRGHTLRLDLSNSLCSPASWKRFYSIAPTLSLKSLVSLVWNGNVIDKSFCDFIKNQPRLSKLSISDCILQSDADEILPELSKVFSIKSLSSFTIRATKPQFVLGNSVVPLLIQLMKKRSLNELDISGQNVGEENILALLDSMPMVMKGIRFNNNNIVNPDKLIQILNTILKKRLTFASWPETDVENIIIATNQLFRNEIKSRIDVLKKEFESRYGVTQVQNDPLTFIHNIKNTFSNNSLSNENKPQVTYGFEGRHVAADKMLKFRVTDDEISNLLNECNSLEGKNPMVSMLEFMEAETSLARLADYLSGMHDSQSSESFVSVRIE